MIFMSKVIKVVHLIVRPLQVWLKNCKVIIDGNNLRFALYKWCPGLNHCFGGDYDKYARYEMAK